MWSVISGILGILGFIISLINLIHYFMVRRVNLEIVIKEYHVSAWVNGNDRIKIHFQANNKSQLPISITDMRIVVNEKLYPEDDCTHEIMNYYHRKKDEVINIPTYNTHLPIILDTLSAKSDYLVFAVPRGSVQNHEKALTFEVHTNRGKQATLSFVPQESQNLRSNFLFLKN